MKKNIIVATLIFLFICPNLGFAAPQVEITPSLFLSEQYDDNIHLDNSNKESEYITILSPGILMNVTSNTNIFTLQYNPDFVWYHNETYEDVIRHSAGLEFGYDITQHTRFGLTGNYIVSDDPVENFEGVESTRDTRNKYHRVSTDTNINYQFGSENSFQIGYNFGVLENEDHTLDDRMVHNPYAGLAYWFNIKNGLEIDYSYTNVQYDSDDDILASENYYTHSGGAAYLRRFQPQTTGSIRYGYTQSFYDDISERYKIHDVRLGLDHAFSSTFSINMTAGYSLRDNEIGEDDSISNASINFNRTFNRGEFSFGGETGWRDDYWEVNSRGLVRYWRAFANCNYQLMEQLNFFAGASYYQDKDEIDQVRQTTRVNTGLRQTFMQWFNVSLEYAYITLDSDDDSVEYDVNRVTLSLGMSKPYQL